MDMEDLFERMQHTGNSFDALHLCCLLENPDFFTGKIKQEFLQERINFLESALRDFVSVRDHLSRNCADIYNSCYFRDIFKKYCSKEGIDYSSLSVRAVGGKLEAYIAALKLLSKGKEMDPKIRDELKAFYDYVGTVESEKSRECGGDSGGPGDFDFLEPF